MKDNTLEDVSHIKQLLFSDTPELAFKMLTNWNKDTVNQHFAMECSMFPLLCLQHLPFLLDGYDKLNFEGKQLSTLPPQIGEVKHLRTLILSNNSLSVLPDKLGCLKTLVNLDLGTNLLKKFPGVLGQLTNLYTLRLEGNEISSLPPIIGSLARLISLNLNDNKITSFPEEFKQLTHLKQLEIINNPLPKSEIEKVQEWLPDCEVSYS